MTDFPADWAIERALEPVNALSPIGPHTTNDVVYGRSFGESFNASILAHARLIEKHEKPPVDPDLLLAREIAANVADDLVGGSYAISYRNGDYDSDGGMIAILKLLKERGK